ncbi:hypothetical protein [Acidipila rosea]|uniref:Uncharacterized protein n=1 Tax=Acidipila rosea TaxID=768535 RepID=A0A4R1L9N2_9BACT|nr:hypothetical protein [Acidipila rosea]TCK75035.1 hypothetical protein C7378_0014 [Acidipila rosea]
MTHEYDLSPGPGLLQQRRKVNANRVYQAATLAAAILMLLTAAA